MPSSNYKFFRLYGYPAFCLIINLIFFLINPYERTFNSWKLFSVWDFVFVMLVSMLYPIVVFETGIQLTLRLNHQLPWHQNIKLRFTTQLLLHIPIITLIGFLFFQIPFPEKFAFNELLFRQVIISGIIFALLATAVFAAEHFFYKWNDSRVEAAKLNEVAVQARLDSLKLQLDPHFLFNNLSTLTSLIEENPALSVDYVIKLSSVYRYVLAQHTKNVIPIAIELEFIKTYLFLYHIRYGDAIRTDIAGPKDFQYHYIAPLTLQLLIENAIKHNHFSMDEPLNIAIYPLDNQYMVVKNNRSPKFVPESGVQLGLKNIKQRYTLLGDLEPVIIATETDFEVRIPLLKT